MVIMKMCVLGRFNDDDVDRLEKRGTVDFSF